MILTGYYGQDLWLKEFELFGQTYRLNNFVISAVFWASQPFNLMRYHYFNNIYSISIVYKKINDNKKSFSDALWNLLGMSYLVVSLLIVIFYADSYIVKTAPKLVIYVFGLSFAKLVVNFVL